MSELAMGRHGVVRLLRNLGSTLAKRLRWTPTRRALTAELAARETVFRAPPLTPELVRAVRAVTPQFHLRASERSRRLWELSQNGSCWGEYEALAPLLASLGRPRRVLELGPGLGRSVVFFKRQLGWQEVPFDLFDASGPARRYPLLAPRAADSFCGDLAALAAVLAHNGVESWRIVDAAATGGRLHGLAGPYDLVYSFYGVGFHWQLADFWAELLPLLGERGVGIFTIAPGFTPFPALAEVTWGTVPLRRILAKDRPLRLLAASRDAARVAPFVEVGA